MFRLSLPLPGTVILYNEEECLFDCPNLEAMMDELEAERGVKIDLDDVEVYTPYETLRAALDGFKWPIEWGLVRYV